MAGPDAERGAIREEYQRFEAAPLLDEKAELDNSDFEDRNSQSREGRCRKSPSQTRLGNTKLLAAFTAGVGVCFLSLCAAPKVLQSVLVFAPSSHAGEPVSDQFPPPRATNKIPSMFPSNVGYGGPTPTGVEAGVVATAPSYPLHTGAPHLLGAVKQVQDGVVNASFDIFRHWGNLSPWYSVPSKSFGLDTTPDAPEGCSIDAMHLLHRHGARYPTNWASFAGPASLARKLANATDSGVDWEASGSLSFLNDWTYKLGGELLTPFGRQQLYDLGVSMRLKYGYLLNNFTKQNALPVFRTESQDRMLYSALNFAIGFFGYPHQDQYLQSITIEAAGFNNTLAPYKTCPNAGVPSKSDRSLPYVFEWLSIYLKDAKQRIQKQLKGFDLSYEDVYTMQQVCAYETVAIGYSKFCELFTEDEWEGFEYALDLYFWYTSAYGSPVARIQGAGWVQELISRLTSTRIKEHKTSTNGTLLDNDTTFPFGHSLYVDATHEVVFLNILTALNLTNFAADGPLPSDHIPKNRKFVASQLSPFATNMQVQILSCASRPESQIRLVINDGVTPLTSIAGCPEDADGMCPLPAFIKAQQELLSDVDWEWECHGDWEVPAGKEWTTTNGKPPKKPQGFQGEKMVKVKSMQEIVEMDVQPRSV
ncbi:phosphoglycerate mutase-like protein [Clavulina sp. PMI_390]|nr:phosphoglycerate mutase-like protein [Clavulina sp. PMI_390]